MPEFSIRDMPIPNWVSVKSGWRQALASHTMWRPRQGARADGKEQSRMSEDRVEALKQLLEQEPHDTMLLFGLENTSISPTVRTDSRSSG